MAFIGGDLTEIKCSHPELGDFKFDPKANESFTIDRGGFTSNDDAAAVTSSGAMIDQINRKRWSVEGPIAVDQKNRTEQDALDALSAHPEPGVWIFSHISGAIYKGTGKPVGDQQTDSNTSQLTLKVSGGGKLDKI